MANCIFSSLGGLGLPQQIHRIKKINEVIFNMAKEINAYRREEVLAILKLSEDL
jgi:hypothetical protein